MLKDVVRTSVMVTSGIVTAARERQHQTAALPRPAYIADGPPRKNPRMPSCAYVLLAQSRTELYRFTCNRDLQECQASIRAPLHARAPASPRGTAERPSETGRRNAATPQMRESCSSPRDSLDAVKREAGYGRAERGDERSRCVAILVQELVCPASRGRRGRRRARRR